MAPTVGTALQAMILASDVMVGACTGKLSVVAYIEVH